MKRITFLILVFFFVFYTEAVFAQTSRPVNVRLASFMPQNSDWGKCLDKMAAEWGRVTNNRVKLVIIHNGREGGEQKTLSSMGANNIQAALFTSFGLHTICSSVMTLSAPFFIRDEAELDLVLKDARPLLDAQVDKKKYVVLAWSKGGWVNIFSKDQILVPDDLRRIKMATNPDDVKFNEAFKRMGFNLVETEINDVGPKITSNVINAFYQMPASVAVLGLHKQLRNMMEMPIAPFLGAIVINVVTWDKIRKDDQDAILRVTQKITSEFEAIMPQMVDNAVSMMRKDGLKVNSPSPAQKQLWFADVEKATPSLMGNTFDPVLYGQINNLLINYRNGR